MQCNVTTPRDVSVISKRPSLDTWTVEPRAWTCAIGKGRPSCPSNVPRIVVCSSVDADADAEARPNEREQPDATKHTSDNDNANCDIDSRVRLARIADLASVMFGRIREQYRDRHDKEGGDKPERQWHLAEGIVDPLELVHAIAHLRCADNQHESQ